MSSMAAPLLPTTTMSSNMPRSEARSREDLYFSKPTLKMPENPRRHTDPVPDASTQPPSITPTPFRPRNRSPYSRSHLRSRSSNNLVAPPMTRARSMPLSDVYNRSSISPAYPRSSSPLGSPGRRRPAIHPRSTDEPFPEFRKGSPELSPLAAPIELEDVAENEELEDMENTPRASEMFNMKSLHPPLPTLNTGYISSNTFPRRYRPASPLRQVSLPQPFTANPPTTTLPRNHSSPLISALKYNEAYPSDDPSNLVSPSPYSSQSLSFSYSSASSVPSTPTSARSRSPSISSLETIPDSPDAEAAALEADRIAKLKAAADASDSSETSDDSSSSSSWRRRGTVGNGSGTGWGPRDREKRKRWSVCGAERRGDFDLETIWED